MSKKAKHVKLKDGIYLSAVVLIHTGLCIGVSLSLQWSFLAACCWEVLFEVTDEVVWTLDRDAFAGFQLALKISTLLWYSSALTGYHASVSNTTILTIHQSMEWEQPTEKRTPAGSVFCWLDKVCHNLILIQGPAFDLRHVICPLSQISYISSCHHFSLRFWPLKKRRKTNNYKYLWSYKCSKVHIDSTNTHKTWLDVKNI